MINMADFSSRCVSAPFNKEENGPATASAAPPRHRNSGSAEPSRIGIVHSRCPMAKAFYRTHVLIVNKPKNSMATIINALYHMAAITEESMQTLLGVLLMQKTICLSS
jgi:hypothetical protein